jgi:hypothetical protein
MARRPRVTSTKMQSHSSPMRPSGQHIGISPWRSSAARHNIRRAHMYRTYRRGLMRYKPRNRV